MLLRMAGLIVAAIIMPIVGFETFGNMPAPRLPESSVVLVAPQAQSVTLSPRVLHSQVSAVAVTITIGPFDATP